MTFNLATSEVNTNPKIWKLKDICSKIGSGATPRGGESAYLDERVEYAFVRSQNVFDFKFESSEVRFISDESAQKLKGVHLKKDDILLNITGDGITFSRCCIVDERILPAAVNQHVAIIRVNQEVCLPGYLLAFLCAPETKAYIASFNAGGSRRAITKGHIESFEIPAASLKRQEAIQNIVYSIIQKIELNRETNQTLEQMAQTIFKSWFVDFDPVKAKMSGEQPEGMDEATASLFPEKLVESELGLIPEDWEASCMGEHFNITMGQSPKGETYNEEGEGIAFFQGRRDFGFRYPDVRVFTTDPKRYAKADDTLISVRAPVGDKNMAAIDCCIGRGVAAIKHKSESRSFTYAFVSHIEKKLGDSGSSGTVFSSINQNELKKVSFVAPPQALIEAFHKLVDPIDQKVQVLSGEIKSLSALRDTLLPKLLSGEIELGLC
jgi:type I restriction enzyme S subunit